ncbi:hypothetical protein RF11_10063 [Thelohanellus kitauei]|uniref:Uncharacterized protein n=1 Tax=Thelohanellus kitauei TaxID=669202 RepID=A0A0C2JWM4_THEKT|nr:hypothetical protein RF11_10063 [Thelohanellus kitauei]
MLWNIPQTSQSSQSCSETFYTKIQSIVKDLIEGLNDVTHFFKLRGKDTLFHHEDLKSNEVRIIDEDFINSVFSTCESHLKNAFDNQISEVSRQKHYIYYKLIMAKTILSFNQNSYLDHNRTEYVLRNRIVGSINSSDFYGTEYKNDDLFDAIYDCIKSEETNSCFQKHIQGMLRWFTLIYEMKFIFLNIHSKFPKLNRAIGII